MKIKVTITLDVDTDAWTLNYGVEGAKKIREDVKTYVFTLVHDQMSDENVDVLSGMSRLS